MISAETCNQVICMMLRRLVMPRKSKMLLQIKNVLLISSNFVLIFLESLLSLNRSFLQTSQWNPCQNFLLIFPFYLFSLFLLLLISFSNRRARRIASNACGKMHLKWLAHMHEEGFHWGGSEVLWHPGTPDSTGTFELLRASTVLAAPCNCLVYLVLAVIHGCSLMAGIGRRRSGFNTNNFEIKCSAAFDTKSGIL